MNGSQYITPPPDFPAFTYKHKVSSLTSLIAWAHREHRERLKYCARRGYVREWTRLHRDYSPIRILAEVEGLRKICSLITPETWKRLSREDQEFIIKAYELRGLLRSR